MMVLGGLACGRARSNYSAEQFEILAACLHPVTERWEYSFCLTKKLAPHQRCAGKLAVRVPVSEPPWTIDLPTLLGTVAS